MLNRGLSEIGLRILDGATDISPRFASRIFQQGFVGVFGSRPIASFVMRKHRKPWERIAATLGETPKILLVADVCIGDTVLISEGLRSIQQAFPKAEVHFVCNRTGGELVASMPGVRVHNIVIGKRGFPTKADLEQIARLIETERYSVILNMGPFLDKRRLPENSKVIQLYVPFAAYILRAWKANGRRHISYFARNFITEFLSGKAQQLEEGTFAEPTIPVSTNTVYLSRESVEMAKAFLDSHELGVGSGLVFFNPDATSQYGQIPFEIQSRLLKYIAGLDKVRAILLGKAYTIKGIEERLLKELPRALAEKIVIVPHLPIEVYTALIDASDMFISGDTGPLHISACRKVMVVHSSADGRSPAEYAPLRNRTAVLAIYGATDSRMYGYDSIQPHHAPANQDVPSRSFSAPAVCRNISCINKFGKSCSEVRCFDGLPEAEIEHYILSYFTGRSGEGRSPKERTPDNRSSDPITITLTPEREYAF